MEQSMSAKKFFLRSPTFRNSGCDPKKTQYNEENHISCLQIIFLPSSSQCDPKTDRHNTRSQAKMLIHHIYNLYLYLITTSCNHLYSSYLDVLFPISLSYSALKFFFSSQPSNAWKMSHIFVFLYKYIISPDQLSILLRSMNSVYM